TVEPALHEARDLTADVVEDFPAGIEMGDRRHQAPYRGDTGGELTEVYICHCSTRRSSLANSRESKPTSAVRSEMLGKAESTISSANVASMGSGSWSAAT